ncbi:MAG: non-ribosomal peptide synthetase, partial [Planctomycetota bacterium]
MHVVPLCVTVSAGETFRSLAHKIHAEMTRAKQHGRYATGNSPHRRAYDVVVNFHNYPFSEFAGYSAVMEWIHPGRDSDALSLQIHDWEGRGDFILDFDLNRDTFRGEEESTVRRYYRLLDAFLEDPDRPLDDVSLMDPEEIERVTFEFARPKAAVPVPDGLTDPVEDRAATAPESTAIVFGERTLSYGELNAAANRVAHYLLRLGAGPETVVGLCVPRSPEMLIGLLGILKAGAAYLPLDPEYPGDRLAYMLAKAEVPLLLTRGRPVEIPYGKAQVVRLDDDQERIAEESSANPRVAVNGENLAYVIFTSGSTGEPNGVQVTRRALAHYTEVARDLFTLTPEDRLLQFASLSFDTAAEEIFPSLAAGATLVLREPGMIDSVQDFLSRCDATGVTVLDLPTAYWHELASALSAGQAELPSRIRLVLVGGEHALADRLQAWHRAVGSGVRLMNGYGPSETTIVATFADLTEADGSEGDEVTIGRPIAGARVYVLDDEMNPVPPGVVGELYIGGAGVARGYLGRPDRTAERFGPSPFGPPGARLYRSGDRARWLHDGNLEFLGRQDDQVKLRGHRIEPGEIESLLVRHPGISEAVVVVTGDSPVTASLTAYVAGTDDCPHASDLRSFVGTRLPPHMIPATFVRLDRLPRLPNGKIDRGALPAPGDGLLATRAEFVGSRDEIERRITRIWEDFLGGRPVGVTDDFFALGGNSITAIRLLTRVEQETGHSATLAALIENGTPEKLAEAFRRDSRSEPESTPAVPIRSGGSGRPLFCVHPSSGTVACLAELARHLGEDRPFWGLEARGVDGVAATQDRIEDMASTYLAAVRSIQPHGPYLLAGYSFGGVIAFEMAQQLRAAGQEIALLA